MKEGERIFCEWANGGYLNSLLGGVLADRFLEDFAEMVREYGTPTLVEIRTEADWVHS